MELCHPLSDCRTPVDLATPGQARAVQLGQWPRNGETRVHTRAAVTGGGQDLHGQRVTATLSAQQRPVMSLQVQPTFESLRASGAQAHARVTSTHRRERVLQPVS